MSYQPQNNNKHVMSFSSFVLSKVFASARWSTPTELINFSIRYIQRLETPQKIIYFSEILIKPVAKDSPQIQKNWVRHRTLKKILFTEFYFPVLNLHNSANLRNVFLRRKQIGLTDNIGLWIFVFDKIKNTILRLLLNLNH